MELVAISETEDTVLNICSLLTIKVTRAVSVSPGESASGIKINFWILIPCREFLKPSESIIVLRLLCYFKACLFRNWVLAIYLMSPPNSVQTRGVLFIQMRSACEKFEATPTMYVINFSSYRCHGIITSLHNFYKRVQYQAFNGCNWWLSSNQNFIMGNLSATGRGWVIIK